jgi:hypothetical protein
MVCHAGILRAGAASYVSTVAAGAVAAPRHAVHRAPKRRFLMTPRSQVSHRQICVAHDDRWLMGPRCRLAAKPRHLLTLAFFSM